MHFEQDIKPLFREGDRDAMRFAFDLWSHDDVSTQADTILGRLEAGTMPCDGAWPAERVAVFRQWIVAGNPHSFSPADSTFPISLSRSRCRNSTPARSSDIGSPFRSERDQFAHGVSVHVNSSRVPSPPARIRSTPAEGLLG